MVRVFFLLFTVTSYFWANTDLFGYTEGDVARLQKIIEKQELKYRNKPNSQFSATHQGKPLTQAECLQQLAANKGEFTIDVDIKDLHPTQTDLSFLNVYRKLEKEIPDHFDVPKDFDVIEALEQIADGNYEFTDGRSYLLEGAGKSANGTLIRGKDGKLAIAPDDRHHTVSSILAALMGHPAILSIKITDCYADKTFKQAMDKLAENKKAKLGRSVDGNLLYPPRNYHQLRNNVLRGFVSDFLVNIKRVGEGILNYKPAQSGYDLIFVKGPDAAPFFEFFVADVLKPALDKHGISITDDELILAIKSGNVEAAMADKIKTIRKVIMEIQKDDPKALSFLHTIHNKKKAKKYSKAISNYRQTQKAYFKEFYDLFSEFPNFIAVDIEGDLVTNLSEEEMIEAYKDHIKFLKAKEGSKQHDSFNKSYQKFQSAREKLRAFEKDNNLPFIKNTKNLAKNKKCGIDMLKLILTI